MYRKAIRDDDTLEKIFIFLIKHAAKILGNVYNIECGDELRTSLRPYTYTHYIIVI